MTQISIGRILGFPTAVDPTALLLLGFYVLSSNGAPLEGVALAIIVFGSVLVHELGHALAGQAYRLGPISITLHGFGGFTSFSRSPSARQGILVTLAGPTAGLALGVVAFVASLAAGALLPGAAAGLLWKLAWFNLFWSVFNLLPMYPMDGGLVLFHALSLRIRSDRALLWAARVGVVMAVLVGAGAVLSGWTFLAILALFMLSSSVPLAMGRRR